MKINPIVDKLPQKNLRPSTLISALRDKKKNYLSRLKKAISTIKNHIANSLYSLFLEKTTFKIWLILKSQFQHILLISISVVFLEKYIKKLVKFENIVNYTSSYQVIYNKIVSLIRKKSYINIKTIKLFLQANMICNLRSEYLELVSSI